ncbi:MAG: hypothetical protein IPM16_18645 [Chloroflexi bacterium]|nr:hypothetical protein [Chloroflexota bacterium]
MRRFGPPVITAALVLLAFGAYRLADVLRAAPPVIDGPSGTVLYASDFEIAPEEWDTYEGRLSARIEGGILKIDVGDVQSAPFVPTRWHFKDFDAQVIAAAVGGPSVNGYGIVFRMRDAGDYYSFLISSDGYYQVTRAVDGVEREISTWIPSDAIDVDFGSPNVLGVRGVGDQFTFSINGQQVELCLPDDPDGQSTYSGGQCFGTLTPTLTDSTHATGQLGLIAVAENEPDVSVVFDNFLVTKP